MTNIEPINMQRAELVQLLPAPRPAAPDRMDWRALVAALKRRFALIVVILAIFVAGGAIITARQAPVYSATAQVVVNTRQPQVSPSSAATSVELPTSDIVATEVVVLQSRSLADKVATALDLDHNPAFAGAASASPGPIGRIKRLIGLTPRQAPPLDPATAHQRVIDRLAAGLSVARLDETYAMQISFNAPSGPLAARIANAFAVQYTHGQLSAKVADTRSATDLLAQRLEGMRQQAQQDADRVEQYRIAHNLLSTTGASLTEQEITSYNEQVASARAQAAEDQARLDTAKAQLRSGSNGGDVGAALDSSVVSALRARRADVGGLLASLEARYGPRYPDVIKARGALADIDSQIAAEIGRVISNLEAKARVSRERLASLAGSLSGAKGTLAVNGRATVGLDDLQRRATASQALYESYLNRYKETSAQEGTERPDARIVSLAQAPATPVSPRPMLNMLLATIMGAIAGVMAALAAETMFAGLTTAEDVEQRLGQNALGVVPTIRSVQPRQALAANAVVETPGGPFAEAIRNLRRSIFYAADRPAQTIAITSALPKEGKTTLALCLARSIATSGGSVVLIDCDLRQRGVTRLTGTEGDRPGVVELLRGEATLEDVLLVDEASGAFLLPQPRHPGDVGDLLIGATMDALLAELRKRFGQVILDTAPALAVADTRVLATKVDALVFVVRWRKTTDHAVRAALRLLPPRFVTIAGVVLSRVDMRRQSRFGYGDASFYYHDYKGYYA
jgi:capsular exopolysaccharide synthesis family protein